ncbi:MAG: lactonase family protein [Chitinophagaceae bacterium]|nr:lactonase family protein [Chitinophagaceae bacterium]
MKKILLPFAFLISVLINLSAQTMQTENEHYMLIGTYTSGKSEGIYVYKFNTATADFAHVSTIKSPNPSFLAVSPDRQFVYAVYEEGNNNKGGSVAAFRFDKQTGKLTMLNQQLSGGDHPCYVAIDKTGKWVAAGNYTGGSAAILPVKEDGSLGEAITVMQHTGSGVNKSRQEKPHVHATVFSKDNRFLFVPDLGTDKVMIYAFDEKTGKLAEAKQPFAKSKDGSGPRHIDFHPNNKYAYLMEEMSGTVVVYAHGNGKLTPLQRISSLPKDFKGDIGSADIHISPDGKFVYASNRLGSNSIAIFKVNPQNGKLSLVDIQSSLGLIPRNFNFDPSANFLLVANQNSDYIVVFKRNKQTGLLTDTGKRIEVGKPVCIKWIPVR